MRMNRMLLATSAMVIAMAGMASAQDIAREDTVIFDLDRTIQDPENFNWMTDGTGIRRMHGAHQTMWEPLFILNYGTGDLDPWLATGFEANVDSTEFTIALREGVTWSDGEAFNADDVVFSTEMAMANEELTAREVATLRGQVASVEKVDDLTVRFTLNAANPRFVVENFGVRIFGSFLVMPEHIWSQAENPATFTFNPPIGTGPYTFTSAASNRAIWDRNDDWWGAQTGFQDLPDPLRVVFLESGGEESRAQLMATNQMDAAQNLSVGTFEAIQAQNANAMAWYSDYPFAVADPCARQLEINTTVAPWDNANMRKAVGMIIDRTQIVNIAAEGATEASRTMFAQYGSMGPFIDAVVAAGYGLPERADVEGGQALLEAEGWTRDGDYYAKDGETLAVEIHVNSASTEYTRTIDMVVEQLQRAGIDARSVPVENSVFWGEVLPFGGFEMSYSWLSCGSVNEPWASMGRYTVADVVPVGERSPGFNNTPRWNTPAAEAYSEVVNAMASMPLGAPEIPGMVADAYQHLDAELPFIPLVQAYKLMPFNTTYWTGWPSNDNYYNHPFFHWNSGHQIIHNLTKAE
ncbi:MAG: ABC transporter substrate-binding protein [Pseudomonadota bacterium]